MSQVDCLFGSSGGLLDLLDPRGFNQHNQPYPCILCDFGYFGLPSQPTNVVVGGLGCDSYRNSPKSTEKNRRQLDSTGPWSPVPEVMFRMQLETRCRCGKPTTSLIILRMAFPMGFPLEQFTPWASIGFHRSLVSVVFPRPGSIWMRATVRSWVNGTGPLKCRRWPCFDAWVKRQNPC